MRKGGFTLIEILIVIVLMGILAVMGVNGLVRMDRSAKLNEAYSQITIMIQSARNYAVNGKHVPDYTDMNKNNIYYVGSGDVINKDETIAANAYGVYFKQDTDKYTVYIFADYENNGSKGSFGITTPDDQDSLPPVQIQSGVIAGADFILEKYELPKRFVFKTDPQNLTFLYYPPLGKFTISNAGLQSVAISICYLSCDNSANPRKEIKMYAESSGLPEKQ
ncbi:type II secretion system protein [Candidatus Peregrinibacteria bacterium]|nr:type II secretion system protein [Candidatus Peregrinibacteria bacterium]